MNKKDLLSVYKKHSNTEEFSNWARDAGGNIHLEDLCGSSGILFAASCINKIGGIHWFILPDREQASYLYNDLTHSLNDDFVSFFASAYKRSMNERVNDEAGLILRTAVLNKLKNIEKDKDSHVFVTYPEALMEKVITTGNLNKNTLDLNVGELISIAFIREVLEEYHFEEVEFVYEPGQFSVRGSIVDIFSYSYHLPYRLDFFGDEVESIRTFDVEDQLSRDKFSSIIIVPNIQKLVEKDKGTAILELLPSKTIIWSMNIRLCIDRVNEIYKVVVDNLSSELVVTKTKEGNSLLEAREVETILKTFRHAEFGQVFEYDPAVSIKFSTVPQPAFSKNFELLSRNLFEYNQKGYDVVIMSENPKQIDRLKDIFRSLPEHVTFIPLTNSIHEGFIDHDLQLCMYTDHQIFERYHKYLINRQFIRSDAISMFELRNLQTGDYIVHIDHGIGVFGGLENRRKRSPAGIYSFSIQR